MCVSVCVCMSVGVIECMCVSLCMYACMFVCVCVRACVCVSVCLSVSVYMSVSREAFHIFRGNEAANRAAKEALHKELVDYLTPFSDLKPLTAKYIHQGWQKVRGEAVIIADKLHEILRTLSD